LNEILDKIHPCLVVSENVWNNQAPQSVMFFY
jgi:mRNA-degrading endonuclease toxin of MazEF toxin-antitoxin module